MGPNVPYPTEYRVEKFYPAYFSQRRPEPVGLIDKLGYGGEYFNVSLSSEDLFGDVQHAINTTVVLIRPGFSTHAMVSRIALHLCLVAYFSCHLLQNMGQRFLQLESTSQPSDHGGAILYVSQLPPNPAVFSPGPALLFVVVNAVPSVGVQVMVGSGKLGQQQTKETRPLPLTQSRLSTIFSNVDTGGTSESVLPRSNKWLIILVLAAISRIGII